MIRKSYTILVVPGETSEVRRIRLPAALLNVLLVAGLLFLGGLGFGVYRYVTVEQASGQLADAYKENRDLKMQVMAYSKRLLGLEAQLTRMSRLDKQIRVITGLEEALDSPEFGTGGAATAASCVDKDDVAPPPWAEGVDAGNELAPSGLHTRICQLMEDMDAWSKGQELALADLRQQYDSKASLFARTPSIWPSRGIVTSDFGWRRSVFTGQMENHEGIDVAAPEGTKVRAPAKGVVVSTSRRHGYGNLIVINHGNGVTTRYGHLSKYHVKPGDQVARGELIGEVGNTGRSTGPHLHYEVRLGGVAHHPRQFILN